MEKECGDSFSGDGFLCRSDNHPISKPMIYHNQKGIKTRGGGKVSDKVAAGLLKWPRGSETNGGKWGDGGMHVRFVLLASRTPFNVFADIRSKAQPPKVGSDELSGFKVARMSSSLMVMTAL